MGIARKCVFIDESGTNELDSSKDSVSNLFICVAVICEQGDEANLRKKIDDISRSLNQGAEIASKRIAKRHKLREAFLARVSGLPFKYVAVLMNKDRVSPQSGLRYKRSFYKFMARKICENVAGPLDDVRVVADEIGSREFMESYTAYLERIAIRDMFREFEYGFVKSNECRLVQLADLIAGSLGYCFDKNKKGAHSARFRTLLRQNEGWIVCWPPHTPIPQAAMINEGVEDEPLYLALAGNASAYLREHAEDADPIIQMQVSVLNWLLFARTLDSDGDQTLPSDVLIYRLQEEGHDSISKQAFTSNVIGGLREAGILLAGTSDGYRLAVTRNDIAHYLRHDRSVIEPMLKRLLIARDTIKKMTGHGLDILDGAENEKLRTIADSFRETSTDIYARPVDD